MGVKRIALFVFLLTILAILVVIFFRSDVMEKIKPPAEAPPPVLEPSPPGPVQMRKIVLFFLSEADTLLHPEEREITASSSIVRQAKQAVEELIKGSDKGYISPFPPETKLSKVEGAGIEDEAHLPARRRTGAHFDREGGPGHSAHRYRPSRRSYRQAVPGGKKPGGPRFCKTCPRRRFAGGCFGPQSRLH